MQGDGSRFSYPATTELELNRAGQSAASHAAIGETAAPPLPDYLVRHYWWAYIWPPAVWFFDHQPIINCIVFGQYRRLRDETIRLLGGERAGQTLLIASAYGDVVPAMASSLAKRALTVIDVAPIQIQRATAKLKAAGLDDGVAMHLMDAEQLRFASDSHDSTAFFLLLHELPPPVRRRVVSEALRVTRPGGRLVLAEYGDRTRSHWFHRMAPLRWVFGTAEPFLPTLWDLDLDSLLAEEADKLGKRIVVDEKVSIFRGFYRAHRYFVESA